MKKIKEQPLALPGPRPRGDLPTFIYVIATVGAVGNCSPVKIGIASNPEKRLASIQTACPNPIRIQTFIGPMSRSLAHDLEREIHHFAARHRLHGEWFDYDPEEAVGLIRDAINALLSRDTADQILGEQDGLHP